LLPREYRIADAQACTIQAVPVKAVIQLASSKNSRKPVKGIETPATAAHAGLEPYSRQIRNTPRPRMIAKISLTSVAYNARLSKDGAIRSISSCGGLRRPASSMA